MAERYLDLVGPRSTRRPPPAWPGWRVVLIVALALISGGVLYTMFTVGTVVREVSHPLPPELATEARPAVRQPGQRTNVLVLVLDDAHRAAEIMLLLSIDQAAGKVGVLQIPCETRAVIVGGSVFDQLGAAHAAGVGDARFPGHLRVLKTVEGLLEVPVHDTITLEPEGFRMLVDHVGGVPVKIPIAMDYDDQAANLHIHLVPGSQKLNGQQALEFVRWRRNNDGEGHPDGESGRLWMQQQFLQKLTAQLVSPFNLPRLPSLAVTVARHVSATIEPARLIALARLAVTIKADRVAVAALPGTDASLPQPDQKERRSYYLSDQDATDRLVDRLVRGIDPREAAAIRVEVAVPDQSARAARITGRLAVQGFAVRTTAAFATPPATTQVIDLRGDASKAQLVARSLTSLGVNVEVVTQPDSKATADVRVIFGPDAFYTELNSPATLDVDLAGG